MKLTDLDFSFPAELIATEPARPSRILLTQNKDHKEITMSDLFALFAEGDVLVVNNTKVLKRRVFAGDLEILFLNALPNNQWEVLFPASRYKVGESIELPQNIQMKVVQKGRPQIVQTSEPLTEAYFEKYGELPLPPYIQKSREERHNVRQDESWYQTQWARIPGSCAAPTASLHFSKNDLENLKKKGVQVCEITLHVGLGTFLPVQVEDLDQHPMHSELVSIPKETWTRIETAKKMGKSVWAMGTTVTRALESRAAGLIGEMGETNLLIQPGFKFKIVDRLLTNFHQPQSTLLALVAGFAELATVRSAYQFAIEKKFRLFSYGDLSVWIN